MQRGHQIGKCAVVSVFFFLLLLPGLQMVTGFPRVPLLDENRNRERPPDLSEITKPIALLSQAQKWFADHYGYRDWLIRAKTQIDYSVFGVSDKVYTGNEGWLYHRNIMDNEEPAEEAMTDQQLDELIAQFVLLRDFLKSHGIRLIVVTNEMKDRFYPEYLPRAARLRLPRHRFEDFKGKLRQVGEIIYIDSTKILEPLKSTRRIFHKTDLHWNDPAAAAVAQTLVDTVAGLEGREVPFWRYPLNLKILEMSGGEARFLPLFYPPTEQALAIDPNPAEGSYQFVSPERPFFKEIIRKTGQNNETLPAVMLYGDSFMDGMLRAGLLGRFDTTYRMQLPMRDVWGQLPSDVRYFIYQFIEIRLPSGLVTELELPARAEWQ